MEIDYMSDNYESEYKQEVGPECPFCHMKADNFGANNICANCEIEAFLYEDTSRGITLETYSWRTVSNCEFQVMWHDNQTVIFHEDKEGFPSGREYFAGYIPLSKIYNLKAFL
jgi:hypothetical protein